MDTTRVSSSLFLGGLWVVNCIGAISASSTLFPSGLGPRGGKLDGCHFNYGW